MILLEYKERIIKYIFCSILLVIVMLIASKFFSNVIEEDNTNDVTPSSIVYEDENTKVNVVYPRFSEKDEVNKIITDDLYAYIKDFRNEEIDKELNITYDLYYTDNIVNIEYDIKNSIKGNYKDNILINLETNELVSINAIYDEEYLKNELYSKVKEKLSSDIYEKITTSSINDFAYVITDDELDVYFNNLENRPYVSIPFENQYHNNDNSIYKHKYIAFTYDDGPSEYTGSILDILNKTKSSATFFMNGDKMRSYSKDVYNIYNSNSEVGSHGYTHDNLKDAVVEKVNYEMNSTYMIFNEITGGEFSHYRPTYGECNPEVFNYGLNVITWNIDTKDWLSKNSKKIYNNIINNACDGCIVLMHDTYKPTVEATEKAIHELNKLGYEVVSISRLMEIKEYDNTDNKVIDYIK